MTAIFRVFFDICIFRRGPQDLPVSGFLLFLALFANSALGLYVLMLNADFGNAIAQFLTGFGILSSFVWCTLGVSRRLSRFIQTLTALLGADTVTSVIALPILLGVIPGGNTPLAIILPFLFIIWNVAVFAHVLRHALSSSYWFGLGLSILYTILSFVLMVRIFQP